jgi:hypothetical protein
MNPIPWKSWKSTRLKSRLIETRIADMQAKQDSTITPIKRLTPQQGPGSKEMPVKNRAAIPPLFLIS